MEATLQKLQARFQAEPSNLDAALGVVEGCLQTQQTNDARQVLGQLLQHPLADATVMVQVAQHYAALGDYPNLQVALERLTRLAPSSPDAWYDLAAIRALQGQLPESLAALRSALELGAQRLKQDPKAKDLLATARQDTRFAVLHANPEFRKLVGPQ